ncbi:MAG: bifunctional phosphoribosylaminoimidazolecarboxamide formyltransferase/IMP cyclohydrolase [Burkholderiaceae bacterium]
MVALSTNLLGNARPNWLPVRRALLSVSNKEGLVAFASQLARLGIELVSTGGTAKTLADAGLTVIAVDSLTQFPEMLDGRVKTLHPAIHGPLLARRDLPEHMARLADMGYPAIDLLVVNLYPFESTRAKPGVGYQELIENIDIGGPAMIRAAAKNHDGVAVVVDPSDYPMLVEALDRGQGRLSWAHRQSLAAKAFAHTAAYDGAIANFLNALPIDLGQTSPASVDPKTVGLADRSHAENTVEAPSPSESQMLPRILSLQFRQQQAMRYGENPHQSAAFYSQPNAALGGLGHYQQLQGKELSFNNLADADAAWLCARSFDALGSPACVIVKHANPCGVALAESALKAYEKAFKTDPTSAFGGILAFNTEIDEDCALAIGQQFAEVILAPGYTEAALSVFAKKANLRLLKVPLGTEAGLTQGLDLKRVTGGLLVQTPDWNRLAASDLRCVTQKTPSEQQLKDLLFAWKVATWVKSNAIVFCKDSMTMGVGAGQMSRLDSARIASIKAGHAGLSLDGTVVASDAFFPFRDGLDVVADAGAVAVIQPGGSVRDDEVIAAANERGLAMVLTGVRHFRH